MNIFEIIGIIAGLSAAIPSIPQIFYTIKTKNVQGLSPLMFCVLAIGGICRIIYGWYKQSWQMEVFNTISTLAALTMLILIRKYSKNK